MQMQPLSPQQQQPLSPQQQQPLSPQQQQMQMQPLSPQQQQPLSPQQPQPQQELQYQYVRQIQQLMQQLMQQKMQMQQQMQQKMQMQHLMQQQMQQLMQQQHQLQLLTAELGSTKAELQTAIDERHAQQDAAAIKEGQAFQFELFAGNKNAMLTAKNETLKLECDALGAQVRARTNQVEQLSKQVEQLKAKRPESKQQLTKLQEQLRELKSQAEERLRELQSKAEEKFRELQSKKDSERVEALRARENAHKGKVVSISQRVQVAENKTKLLEVQLESAKQEARQYQSKADKKIKALKIELAQKHNGQNQDANALDHARVELFMRADLDAVQVANRELKGSIASLEERSKQQQAEHALALLEITRMRRAAEVFKAQAEGFQAEQSRVLKAPARQAVAALSAGAPEFSFHGVLPAPAAAPEVVAGKVSPSAGPQ
jgi:hypothetical protein